MPDALSRAPLPTKNQQYLPEVNLIVIPPPEISPFLLSTLCFNLCSTDTDSQLCSFPLKCVYHACFTQLHFQNHALTYQQSTCVKTSSVNTPITTTSLANAVNAKTPLQDHMPRSKAWPDDFEHIRTLNFDKVHFTHKQRQDLSLGSLAQFLTSQVLQSHAHTFKSMELCTVVHTYYR